MFDFIFSEERITWEEFNIYGADAGEASSDSQDGNNESPRYEIFMNRQTYSFHTVEMPNIYCRVFNRYIISENARKMKIFVPGREPQRMIRV